MKELEQFLTTGNAENKYDGQKKSGYQKMTLKRNFMDQDRGKISAYEIDDECSSRKSQKFSEDYEKDDLFIGSDDEDIDSRFVEIGGNDDFGTKKRDGKEKSNIGKLKMDLYKPSTSTSQIKDDLEDSEDLDQKWTLKYLEKTEKVF